MPSTRDLRAAVAGLSTIAARDLKRLWQPSLSADRAKERLLNVLPDLSRTYRLASSTVAADWYDELRDARKVRGRFAAVVPDLDDAGADALAGWAVGPLFDAEPSWERAFALAEGGLQLRIANAARDTVRLSSVADPRARGWEREASAASCDFCHLLAGRGAVYTEATADFEAHDRCDCVAVPAFT